MAKGGKTSTNTTQTTGFDPITEWFRNQIMGAAKGAQGSVTGLDPQTQSAIDAFTKMMQGGNQGLLALGGNADATKSLLNPYQQNVIDASNAGFAKTLDTTRLAINDAATRAGAFGGSRHGVAEGQAMGDVATNQANTIAGLNYQGFTDAMGRAGQLANLGFGAAQQLPGLGQYAQMMNDPNLRNMMLYGHALGSMPQGMTMNGTNTTTEKGGFNPLNALPGLFSLGQKGLEWWKNRNNQPSSGGSFSPGAGAMFPGS